ncbi:MAG: pantetheine-phosphate adenylyltransferase [Candidatus Bathyarchaeota archaeon]|nr:MAG: pantetheine-phosphate adenylyltransferase [Candidatus Bathyarchaeota archaeon]
MSKRFKVVAVGGTFDEFHKGHRVLLKTAFEIGQRVMIGVCTDVFVEKMKKPHEVAPFAVRLEELKSFLLKHDWLERSEIVPLHDSYGPASTSKKIEAIVVSQETKQGAISINERRKAKCLPTLSVIIIEMVLAENCNPISTTRIRCLEIDHEGRLIKSRIISKNS